MAFFDKPRTPSVSDLTRSLRLLNGFTAKDARGSTRYFKKNSPEEMAARRSIARLLRKGSVDPAVLGGLADLFDPPRRQHRRLQFVSSHQGRARDHQRDARIIMFLLIRMRMDESVGQSIIKAAKKYKLSEEMIKKIWAAHKRLRRDLRSGRRAADFTS